ncbi:DUF6896 domain-containing protein [Deinococcus cellulosilyticus]|nr:hypothetical protein [Deinococcus cellulosilyticus]
MQLYSLYQNRIREVIHRLQLAYSAHISPENAGEAFPAHGELEGLEFHFHGLGCTALLEGQVVAWDWLSVEGDRHDLIVPWMMWRSLEHLEGTEGFDAFKAQLSLLVEQGTLKVWDGCQDLLMVVHSAEATG